MFRETITAAPKFTNTSFDAPGLVLKVPQGAEDDEAPNILEILRDPDHSDDDGRTNVVEWLPTGQLEINASSGGDAAAIVVRSGDTNELVRFQAQSVAIEANLNTTMEPEAFYVNKAIGGGFGTLPDPTISMYKRGMFKFSGSTPADGDVATASCFMYFDSTNGAAKVKWKGKTLDGTVVTGEVALI